MHFENCPSHTELKINERGIFVIETSPRLGGDYITSTLVPLSTGINIEDQLLHIALGESVDTNTGKMEKASGVCFFCLPEGVVRKIDFVHIVLHMQTARTLPVLTHGVAFLAPHLDHARAAHAARARGRELARPRHVRRSRRSLRSASP